MKDDQRIDRTRDNRPARIGKFMVISLQLGKNLLQAPGMFPGCNHRRIGKRKPCRKEGLLGGSRGFEVGLNPSGGTADSRLASGREHLQRPDQRHPARRQLRQIMEKLFFLTKAELHGQEVSGTLDP